MKIGLIGRIGLIGLMCGLALAGCVSGSGAKWYAPATWLSHAPAAAVDRAESRVELAQSAAVRAAQRATHETQVALLAAPQDSRPVAVAAEANDTAVALLDQAAGPLTAGELSAIRQQVAGLLSENAQLRAGAEAQRAADRRTAAQLGEELAQAQAARDAAQAKLRTAFERENALANELRTERWWSWFWKISLGTLAVLAGAAYIYARFALGGIPQAIGKGLVALRGRSPEAGAMATQIFDGYLNRNEQAKIAQHT